MTLALDQATLVRGSRSVFSGVTLHVAPGEIVGLLGANGAGKSSLLGVLAGDLPLQAGAATMGGRSISHFSMAQLARQRAVLAQQTSLPFDLSVGEIVAMGAYPFPELSPAELAREMAETMACTGLKGAGARRYMDLSGGEQQRVHYARVLLQCRVARQVGTPRFLLLDEPTAHQDPAQQQHVLRVAARLAHEEGAGVLVVLHDINLAARWCDRILLLAEGTLIGAGTPEQVLTPDRLERVYGVQMLVVPHPSQTGRWMAVVR